MNPIMELQLLEAELSERRRRAEMRRLLHVQGARPVRRWRNAFGLALVNAGTWISGGAVR
jgi:hypothetical protein